MQAYASGVPRMGLHIACARQSRWGLAPHTPRPPWRSNKQAHAYCAALPGMLTRPRRSYHLHHGVISSVCLHQFTCSADKEAKAIFKLLAPHACICRLTVPISKPSL